MVMILCSPHPSKPSPRRQNLERLLAKMTHMALLVLVGLLSGEVMLAVSATDISGPSSELQKHPQEFFCEADFVIVAKVLRKTTSHWSVVDDVPAFLICMPPVITPVLLVKVKHVFKGHDLVTEGDTVTLIVSCRESADLRVMQRRTYVFTGFVHLENVPKDSRRCVDSLATGRHVFEENQLNLMLGCSWIHPRSQLTAEQKQGLAWAYSKSCDCQIIKCHGRAKEPPTFCFGELQRALEGDGCVMHRDNNLQTAYLMTCSRLCDDDTCKWVTCSSRKSTCGCVTRHRARGKLSTEGVANESAASTSKPNVP